MAIYSNGKEIENAHIGGQKVDKMYYRGGVIYESYVMPKIVTFQGGTDDEIAAMLEAHYRGLINIGDHWKIGDTRKVHINAIKYSENNSTSHVAQDMTMIIMDFNHDDLSTPINGKTKAAVSVGFREAMGNNGTGEYVYYWGQSHIPVENTENYSHTPLRKWLNGDLLNALPTTFSSIIKEVNKKNLAEHYSSNGAPIITKDKIWLLSYPEVFGTVSYDGYINRSNPKDFEGTQYKYMKTSNNRMKYANENGSSGRSCTYWLRSPSSTYYNSTDGYRWITVNNNGAADAYIGSGSMLISPGFCL